MIMNEGGCILSISLAIETELLDQLLEFDPVRADGHEVDFNDSHHLTYSKSGYESPE